MALRQERKRLGEILIAGGRDYSGSTRRRFKAAKDPRPASG